MKRKKIQLFLFGLGLAVLAAIFIQSQFKKQEAVTSHRQAKQRIDIQDAEGNAAPERILTPEKKKRKVAQKRKKRPDNLAFDQLKESVFADDAATRMRAALELRNVHSPESIALLSELLNDVDDAVMSEAIDALCVIGRNSEYGEMVFNLLEEKAKDTHYPFRSKAIVTAAMLGMDDQMMPIIADILEKDPEKYASDASRAMTFIAAEWCVPYLEKVLQISSSDPETSFTASVTLLEINTPESIAIVEQYLYDKNDATQALGAKALSLPRTSLNWTTAATTVSIPSIGRLTGPM